MGVLLAVALQLVLYLLYLYLYELPRCEREAAETAVTSAGDKAAAQALSLSVGTQKTPPMSSSSESGSSLSPLRHKSSNGVGFGCPERGEDELRLMGSVALNDERAPILPKKPAATATKKEKGRPSAEKVYISPPASTLPEPTEGDEQKKRGVEEKTTCGGGTELPRYLIAGAVFLLLFSILLRLFQDSYLKPPTNKH